jgi:hypothetical protein
MPNPVLLAQNVTTHQQPSISQQLATGGILTNIWEVDVPVPSAGQDKPL